MLVSLITIISMLQYAVIAQFPNGTDTKIHFFTCNPDAINVSSIELFDRNDLPMYPIKLSELATIKLKSYNNGDMIKKNKVNVEIFEYKEEDGIWKWKNIIPEPFRFLLHNIDGCKMANNCPLTKGDLDLILPLDLYKYAILFSFIDKTSAHQFIIKMFNAENHQEVACETIQFKLI